ncbi:MAG: DNA polymerase Y family protein [Proteobacteria bacterium]|nr:DNA polymerase Y family protein [Pseudomonadota bacterium]
MRRVISVWLPTLATDRLRRHGNAAVPADKPLITATHDGRRQVVAAADRVARSLGLYPGMAVAQAQAMVPGLPIAAAEPKGDARALDDLAAWCLRYAPLTAPDRPDGIWIEAAGVAHLFGGEAALLADLVARLARGGVTARAAIADTPGTAWAVARYAERPITVVAPSGAADALRHLPIAALRLPEEVIAGLARLGFERIDQLTAAPRPPLALRFGPVLMRRLDQAFGRLFEPIEPVSPSETVSSRMTFPEPLLTPEALTAVVGRLTHAVCAELERREEGARQLDLVFERVDRTLQAIRIGTARPSRTPQHLARLLDEQLERVDPGLGIEAMRLAVPLVEPLSFTQPRGGFLIGQKTETDLSVLVDRLINRLGDRRVYRVAPVESDVPERSVRRIGPLSPAADATWPPTLPRPTRLLKPPQPVEALAMLPDHPPAFFIWRRRRHRIRRTDGPERIAGEWWRLDGERRATRDYWQVEDDAGRRFWLYRSGDAVDPETGDLRWFLHGFF